MNNDFSWDLDYLSHHGIDGMRWGQRNGPPYPLDPAKDYSKRERKLANTGSSKSSSKGSTVGSSSKLSPGWRNSVLDHYEKLGKIKVNDIKCNSQGLTQFSHEVNGQKISWISGLLDAHDVDWMEVNEMQYGDGSTGWSTASREIARNPDNFRTSDQYSDSGHDHKNGQITDHDLQTCNPGFGQRGTTQNCADCTAAMEMKLRGYEVNAGRQSFPSAGDAMEYWFKGAKQVQANADVAEDAIKGYGKHTSGKIGIAYPDGGGHAMHWTVDDNGTFEIQDGQNGRRFSSITDCLNTYGANKDKVDFCRLDNCEPNLEAMENDSVIRIADSSNKVWNQWEKRMVDTW